MDISVDGSWKDDEILETSSTSGETEFVMGLAEKRAARLANTEGTMEDWETSTSIDEAESATGRRLRRDETSEWHPTHLRTSSWSTMSSMSIETTFDGEAEYTDLRARVWSNVVATLNQRRGGAKLPSRRM